MDEIIAEIKRKNENTLAVLQKEFNTVRTGRASLSLLDGIMVACYGGQTPLNQVASLAVPEARLIVIQPWDASITKDIERAIIKSDLGLNPVNDGKLLRVPIPALTEERRRELVKVVKRMTEDCKVAIRNNRREGIDGIKKLEKEAKLTEDEMFKGQDEAQKITDHYTERVNKLLVGKEQEIMEV
ncbi:MAG: ribosome recycling factor [Thermodesulfobacteriota bacterium]